ncbi:MAG: DUF4149 domain-containing protein [Candidatus Eisenbacteria bacterium]|nr:DUF4149 domain-containing protein [Candidatus Eisenbacteria bacterium]
MSEARLKPVLPKVVSLPRTRRLAWASVCLEYAHQLVLAFWIGGLAAIALLVGPSLFSSIEQPQEAAWAGLELVLKTSFMGAGAGALLLLTTLLMHLLSLRSVKTTLIQTGFLLGMTFAAVTIYIAVAPPMEELLKNDAAMIFADPTSASATRFAQLHRLADLLVLAQIVLGASLLLLGVRRWYRYVQIGRPAA